MYYDLKLEAVLERYLPGTRVVKSGMKGPAVYIVFS